MTEQFSTPMRRFLAAALICLFALPAMAQTHDPYADNGPQFWRKLELQLIQSLDSPMDELRYDTMKNIVYMATFYKDKLDLGRVVPRLIETHKETPKAVHGAMALAALQAVGNSAATKYLNKHLTLDEVNAVRELMVSVLAQHHTVAALPSVTPAS